LYADELKKQKEKEQAKAAGRKQKITKIRRRHK
jgi:hypothetical protein